MFDHHYLTPNPYSSPIADITAGASTANTVTSNAFPYDNTAPTYTVGRKRAASNKTNAEDLSSKKVRTVVGSTVVGRSFSLL